MCFWSVSVVFLNSFSKIVTFVFVSSLGFCIDFGQLIVLVGSDMGEVTKLLYVVVVDDGEKREKGKESFRYTRPVLQSALQLMGCKARHAFKVVLAIQIFSLFNVRVVCFGVQIYSFVIFIWRE